MKYHRNMQANDGVYFLNEHKYRRALCKPSIDRGSLRTQENMLIERRKYDDREKYTVRNFII
jgi:hypothetical protein